MSKLKVAVLFGGQSSEYSVSLHSASSALRKMPKEYALTLIGISQKGNWYYYEGSIDQIEHDHWLKGKITPATLSLDPKDHGFIIHDKKQLRIKKVDVIFPILHGTHGEDGTVQAACELAGIPCVGCGMTSSALCMDKEYTHIVADHLNVPMAKWLCIRQNENRDDHKLFNQVKKEIGLPCIIKPCNAGSSYGVSKASNEAEFLAGLKDAYQYDCKLIIEEFMKGFEVGCAVMSNKNSIVIGLNDEIEMKDAFFNFEEKYTPKTSVIHVPARIAKKTVKELNALATTMYKGLDCKGMARVDCFVVNQKVYLNELNSIPGFTGNSRFPTMMAKAGHPFEEVIRYLVDAALEG